MLLRDMFGRKTIVFYHEPAISIGKLLVREPGDFLALSTHNEKMPAKRRQSDFRDCSPISSPSKKARKVSQESAPPERVSSSDNEVEDSLVSCG